MTGPPRINNDPRELTEEMQRKLGQLLPLANHDSHTPEGKPKFEGFHHWELFEGYRPQSRQDWLYAQGRTRGGEIVTWRRHSLHTERVAGDIIWVDTKGIKRWDGPDELWAILGHCAREVGLEWGGDWKSTPDNNHVQLKGF